MMKAQVGTEENMADKWRYPLKFTCTRSFEK